MTVMWLPFGLFASSALQRWAKGFFHRRDAENAEIKILFAAEGPANKKLLIAAQLRRFILCALCASAVGQEFFFTAETLRSLRLSFIYLCR
jgi:hypothetical protein